MERQGGKEPRRDYPQEEMQPIEEVRQAMVQDRGRKSYRPSDEMLGSMFGAPAPSMDHGAPKGKGMGGKGPSLEYVQKNREITEAARDPSTLLNLLETYAGNGERLNMVNITTILHRLGKLRLWIPENIVRFLTESINGPYCQEEMRAQAAGNARAGRPALHLVW